MGNKTRLKIGEFSRLMQVTVKTRSLDLRLRKSGNCYTVIGPEKQRLGCKCPPPGYYFTIEHNKEYTPTDIDIEYCEQVEEVTCSSKGALIVHFFNKLNKLTFRNKTSI